VLSITVTAATSASPERVLALAGTDFSADRAKVWSNVAVKRLAVHERGDTYAELTEGATDIAWFAWERSRYDWSRPGIVKQTVLDSNVLEPGSIWELRVAPGEGGGSEVEMTLQRRFRRSPSGAGGYVFNHLAGRRGWAWYLRSALKAVEQTPERSGRENASAPAA
jgi:hypothetical protein